MDDVLMRSPKKVLQKYQEDWCDEGFATNPGKKNCKGGKGGPFKAAQPAKLPKPLRELKLAPKRTVVKPDPADIVIRGFKDYGGKPRENHNTADNHSAQAEVLRPQPSITSHPDNRD